MDMVAIVESIDETQRETSTLLASLTSNWEKFMKLIEESEADKEKERTSLMNAETNQAIPSTMETDKTAAVPKKMTKRRQISPSKYLRVPSSAKMKWRPARHGSNRFSRIYKKAGKPTPRNLPLRHTLKQPKINDKSITTPTMMERIVRLSRERLKVDHPTPPIQAA